MIDPPLTRAACIELDRADPLAGLRDGFALPDGVVYLDGNSLGALPKKTASRVAAVVAEEWGNGLIRSWNDAGWIDLAQRAGAKLAPLIGASAAQISIGDSTSVNLFKALSAAVALQHDSESKRNVIVSERGNFPTDLYIAKSIAAAHGMRLATAASDDLVDRLGADTAVLLLTHVNYRNGRMHDMAALTRAAHAAGALVVWDLAHSAGALPVDLFGDDADFAVGCGYKYLNGGPGAPAFVWAHPRHLERMERERLRQPLSGWLGHAAPFDFAAGYEPASGIGRFQCGTPPILSLAALDVGLDVFAAAEASGGIAALRAKSLALSALFIALVDELCPADLLTLVTPRADAQRGSQVSYAHAHGQAVMAALIERGVIGDFRRGAPASSATSAVDGTAQTGDLIRFGFAPLYNRYLDVWDAVTALADVLASGSWQQARVADAAAVT